jgi:fluoroquinolone transport system permease protein
MTRFASTLRLDVTLQFRNKFYHIGVMVALLGIFALRGLFDHQTLKIVLPVLYLIGLAGTTYFFIGGLVIFEKSERTIDSLIITPLRFQEYLLSKLVTLSALATVESVVITVATVGLDFHGPLLVSGIVLMAGFYTLLGYIVVLRYQSVTDFLMPSLAYSLILQLPFLPYFGVWENALFYLIPTQAPFLLMQAAFQPVENWQIVYGFGYSLLSIAFCVVWARRAFHHFIVLREGM